MPQLEPACCALFGSAGNAPAQPDRESLEDKIDIEDQVKSSDSIYALTVCRVINTGWYCCGTWRLVGALCFTVILQLALVGLLWQVAATGNLNFKRSEADNIWVELGRTCRHLVQLQDNLTRTPPTENLPAPCLETLCEYWPHFSEYGSHTSRANTYNECWEYFCCMVAHPECLIDPKATPDNTLNTTIMETYLDTTVKLEQFVDLCYTTLPPNMTKRDWFEHGCNTVVCAHRFAADHELPELEYGWGLFHVTDSTPQLTDPSKCGGSPSPEHEFVGHVNDWFHRNRYEHEPTTFIMVSYLVMLVVSFNEVRQALQLLVYSAAKAGALPENSFFYPNGGQQAKVPNLHDGLSTWSICFILAAPVLQLLVAFVLMSCGGGLLLILEMQNSRAAIIFNAVALAFVVDIDDKIGLIMKMQQPWMQRRSLSKAGGTRDSATRAQCSCRAGYVVFAIAGWLLLSHSLLVAPQTPAQMLAFFTTTRAYVMRGQADIGAKVLRDWNNPENQGGMTFNMLRDPTVRAVDYMNILNNDSSIWNTFAFLGFAGLTRLPNKSDGLDVLIDRTGAIWMCSVYLLVAMFTVMLLCHSLLPCKAEHWPWVLTGVQILLVIVAQLQYLTMYKKLGA